MPTHSRRAGTGPRRAEPLYATTLRLLGEHGFDGLTVEGVAAAAGVDKTTVYRWWHSKAALVADALIHSRLLDLDVADTGSLRTDLLALAARVRELLTGETTAPLATALVGAATASHELAAVAGEFFAERLHREQAIVDRAVARGELSPDVDVMSIVDLLLGAVWARTMLRRLPADATLDAHLVDVLLTGLTPRDTA